MTRYESSAYLDSKSFPFHISIYVVQTCDQVLPHSHEFVELAYIAGGSGRHTFRDVEFPILEGDVFIIEPDEVHAYSVESGENLIVYNVLFEPSLLKHEISLMSGVTPFIDFYYVEPFLRHTMQFQSHLRLKPADQLEMKAMLERLLLEYKEKHLGYQILIKTKLLELFIFLSRCYESYHYSPITSLATDEKMILLVCDFIRQHYAKPLTLTQISQLCGMSKSSFSVKFKHYTGQTFIDFRNDVRIHHAAESLLKNDDKVIAIAQNVGFDDVSHFNKQFKSILGCSPVEYRQRHKSNYSSKL